MIRVLQVHGGMNVGGTESVLMNWYRNIDKKKIQFDFTSTFKEKCPYDDEIIKMGGKIKYIRSVKTGGYIGHCIDLYKVIKKGKYEVVHSHMNFHGGVVAIISKILGVKKVICHSHSAVESKNLSIKNKILQLLINKFADEKVACGIEAGKYIFGKQKEFKVLNNAIDFKKLNDIDIDIKENLIRKYKLKEKKIIIQIGRIDDNKNQKFTIDLISKITRLENIIIFFIGDGELREKLEKLVFEKGLNDIVKFIGIQKNIKEWISLSDSIILPSRYEGVPMVVIEGQALGKRCIISDKVSVEADLGLGNVEFISIEKPELWKKKILENSKKDIVSGIEEKLKAKKFLIESVIDDLERIYNY